jgi:AcrR family transcriptional regulator
VSVRRLQKEATRKRVLDAARELFEGRGYQETTVREIASRAGVSVGSVFTTFASKDDILSEVMQERLEHLYGELDRLLPQLRGSTPDRLRSMFAIHYAFEASRTKLFLAHIAAAFDWTISETTLPYGRATRLKAIIHGCLVGGIKRGDVDPAVNLEDVVELLLAAYAWTWRLVAWQGADAEAMSQVMDRQIGLIAHGFVPRPASEAT